MTKYLSVKNWEKWQTYRKDRGQPPWIKVHRCLMRNPEWVSLTDAERGQLVGIWLLAADRNGDVPASPAIIQKLCFMESQPDINKFTDLGFIENGWRRNGVVTASGGQPNDQPKAEKRRVDKKEIKESLSSDVFDLDACCLTLLLYEYIKDRQPNIKKPNFKIWIQDMDRLLRLDKREHQQVARVISWCQADRFWQINIRSPDKLRKQYDQLWEKMNYKPEDKDDAERRRFREIVRNTAKPV